MTLSPRLLLALLFTLSALPDARAGDAADTVAAGSGRWWLRAQGSDTDPPPANGRTEAMRKTAAQTNQWYSALIFSPTPVALYALPLSVKGAAGALEIAQPSKDVIATDRKDTEIHYVHRDPVRVSPVAFAAGPAQLARAGDWDIDIALASGADRLLATVGHGSPYVYFHVSRGDLRIDLPAAARRSEDGADARALVLQAGDRRWAFFGPTGVRFEAVSPTQWIAHLPAGRDYLSAAALPDATPATLALFTAHAYAFVEDTRVSGSLDLASSRVETRFEARTRAVEGSETKPLLGLYPHQWFRNATVADRLGPGYDTLRGRIALLADSGFATRVPYHGFVPFWPGVKDGERAGELKDLTATDVRNARRMMLENGKGPYWQGKGLMRIVELMNVVEQQGDLETRDALLKMLEGRMESWFDGQSRKTYFRYAASIGTVVAYPEEYFAIEQLNDHHFHYGYWIRAAAEIALRDPAWASKERWGPMVDLLVADIATTRRGGADFPFLRTYDPYESHSWASGIGLGDWGNNQESSSEAVNAWAGLILWGEVKRDRALRDLGAWLYASEIEGIQHYWFDLHHLVLPPEYRNTEVSMLFGAKIAHNTWWIDDPREIKGINLLPITTASLYLGRDPGFVKRSVAELPAQTAVFESRGKKAVPPDIWQDVFAEYLALADPKAALAGWNRWGAVELGDTRSHTLHWLLSLDRMGTPALDVTADTALYSVFRRADGRVTHLAYNPGDAALVVKFSDGTRLEVPPHRLAGDTP